MGFEMRTVDFWDCNKMQITRDSFVFIYNFILSTTRLWFVKQKLSSKIVKINNKNTKDHNGNYDPTEALD